MTERLLTFGFASDAGISRSGLERNSTTRLQSPPTLRSIIIFANGMMPSTSG